MTLKEEMKRQKEEFWQGKKELIKKSIDKICHEMLRYQEGDACYRDKYYIKITREYDNCGANVCGNEYMYHGCVRLVCRIGHWEDVYSCKFEVTNFAYGNGSFEAKFMNLLAMELKVQGFDNLKEANQNSGDFTAEINLQ